MANQKLEENKPLNAVAVEVLEAVKKSVPKIRVRNKFKIPPC